MRIAWTHIRRGGDGHISQLRYCTCRSQDAHPRPTYASGSRAHYLHLSPSGDNFHWAAGSHLNPTNPSQGAGAEKINDWFLRIAHLQLKKDRFWYWRAGVSAPDQGEARVHDPSCEQAPGILPFPQTQLLGHAAQPAFQFLRTELDHAFGRAVIYAQSLGQLKTCLEYRISHIRIIGDDLLLIPAQIVFLHQFHCRHSYFLQIPILLFEIRTFVAARQNIVEIQHLFTFSVGLTLFVDQPFGQFDGIHRVCGCAIRADAFGECWCHRRAAYHHTISLTQITCLQHLNQVSHVRH